MPHHRLGLIVLASLGLVFPAVAHAQHVPRARRIGAVVVGEARLELLAYDDGTVTAGTSATMTSAMARWRGDELRAWLDTANAVMRAPEPAADDGEVTVSTPIDGLWLVRQMRAKNTTYVLSVISPASPEVLDAAPTAAQVQTLLKLLARADAAMRSMTPDSLLHSRLAGRGDGR
ncbi:MAG TPA: hypothetical protein VF034_00370 [Gemmatimonadaceae bacterium]|jgi:hypothetical protein